ncbi:hypothetical protein [Hymenobacter lucidus]|uniref:DUF4397 domain-containing protein n=1 Tax=Hymenobacter lucidus TaxID=2880930 RepID=A0ABS8APN0_9BACT|nr:hypothetical protein [Hymenobacter lucidus]MCB2408059.1 hypothetical protein [Hymenobacter lucidus]
MKSNLFTSMKMPLSGLLLGSITLFSSCSKEQDAFPVEAPIAVTTQANALRVEGVATQGETAYFRYDSGGFFYGASLSHTEVADEVRLEFWTPRTPVSPSRLVFVARDVATFIADNTAGNYARYYGVDFAIPLLVPAGQYTLVIRTQSADKSLTIATTGNPATYVHSLSTGITVQSSTVAPGFEVIPDGPPSSSVPFYFSYPLTWNSALFSNYSLRSFARNETTGTTYQLTTSAQSYIYNDGTENIILNQPNKPEYLPTGTYMLYLDDFAAKTVTLERIIVGQ